MNAKRYGIAATVLGVLSAMSMLIATARAAEQFSEDTVKAAFLYRFAGYVEWPEEALANPQFTIAVIGSDGVVTELQRLLPNHSLKNRPAQVRKITAGKDLGDAQMLYVGLGHADEARAIIAAVAAKPVLVVTDEERGLDAGSSVNFLLVDRRIRFEISLAAAERSGLKISSDMLSVAARVQGGRLRSDVICTPIRSLGELRQACPERVAVALEPGGAVR